MVYGDKINRDIIAPILHMKIIAYGRKFLFPITEYASVVNKPDQHYGTTDNRDCSLCQTAKETPIYKPGGLLALRLKQNSSKG
jgi:hypothetical protein